MYILFYSKHCKFCDKFIKVLQNLGEDKFFNGVSVDKVNGVRPKIISQYKVTEVPTIIVNGKSYSGKIAFKWLEDKIKSSNQQISSQDTRANKTPIITGYSSDNCSQLMINNGTTGTSQYSFLNDVQKINTPDEDSDVSGMKKFILPNNSITGSSREITDKMQDKAQSSTGEMEKMKMLRDQQDAMFKKR